MQQPTVDFSYIQMIIYIIHYCALLYIQVMYNACHVQCMSCICGCGQALHVRVYVAIFSKSRSLWYRSSSDELKLLL